MCFVYQATVMYRGVCLAIITLKCKAEGFAHIENIQQSRSNILPPRVHRPVPNR